VRQPFAPLEGRLAAAFQQASLLAGKPFQTPQDEDSRAQARGIKAAARAKGNSQKKSRNEG